MGILTTGNLMTQIETALSILTTKVRLSNSRGRTDINADAEDFYCGLLNLVLDKHLKNQNLLTMDFPAIDLADEDGGLCVQVTSTEGRSKITGTLEKFFRHDLHKKFHRLMVLVIGEKDSFRKTFPTEDGFSFNPDRDIWDTPHLLHEIGRLSAHKQQAVLTYLEQNMNLPLRQSLRLALPLPEHRVGFLGRRRELAEIGLRMEQRQKPVIVAGLGGVGKTMLVSEFARMRRGNTYFLRFDTTFTRTLAEGASRCIPAEQRQNLTEADVAELALNLLEQCGGDDLLIVDNAEISGRRWRELTADPFYDRIRALPMAVLMTTRNRDAGGLWIGNLERDELRQIFRGHEAMLSESEMDSLIDAVGGHTMTVDMIARTIRESWGVVTAEQIRTAMETSTLSMGDYDEIETDHDPEQRQIYAHLRALFDLSGIEENGRQALRCAALLPPGGISGSLFLSGLPGEAAREIKQLEKRGWVELKDNLVTIHPVVRLVCRTELQPTDENCDEFLTNIYNQHDPNVYDHKKYAQMASLLEEASTVLEDRSGYWAGEAGYLWNELTEPQKALACNLRSAEKCEQHQPNSNNLSVSYNNLGISYGKLGNHEKALEYQLKALTIRERVLPENHPDLALSYNNVGGTYGDLGDQEKALEYQLKALNIIERVLPENHPNLAASYNNVGSTYGELGDWEKALEHNLKALNIRERVLPENHPDLAASYNNVGYTYSKVGDHKKALEYQLKALNIRERVLPENHPDLALSYNNVGSTYGDLGDHKKALEYKLKALTIWERVLPENHPDLATSYNNVTCTYYAMSNLPPAAKHMRRAAEIIRRSSLPENHPNRVNYIRWADELEQVCRLQNPNGIAE